MVTEVAWNTLLPIIGVCTGLNGSDFSKDEGKNWTTISTQSFNACRKAAYGKQVFFAGNNGTIGKLIY